MKFTHCRSLLALAAVLVSLVIPQVSRAGAILSAVSVSASNSFPDPLFGTATNLINQGGLVTKYISGVTDFDAYMGGNPQHTVVTNDAEWFTDYLVTGATLTFDFGAVVAIDRVAAWVDEFWGVGNISVSLSLNGISYTSVGSFVPTDWPVTSNTANTYGADVFSFAATSGRFVQLGLSNCPQPQSSANGGCGMGEVAFRQADVSTVPEPAGLALVGVALAGMAMSRRRR